VFVALVAVAIVSLKYASEVWLPIILALTMLAFFVALIVAAVDRGHRQSYAIGFTLTFASYVLIIAHSSEIDPGGGSRNPEFSRFCRLPTTRLLTYVHRTMDHSYYFDSATGKRVQNYSGGGSVGHRELPPLEFFMQIGHCWWGLLLGYLGGKFAVFVYNRRLQEQKSLAARPS
jgi:hypothetical protein